MANKQLVTYIREQLSHKADINQLRLLLATQGWSQADVEDAINEVYSGSKTHNVKSHHTNFVAVTVLAIIVLMLGAGLFMVVFKETDVSTRPTSSIEPPKTSPSTPIGPRPTEAAPPSSLSGWAVCAADKDSEEKHDCYYKINKDDVDYNCDEISDKVERSFCYRAKEAVLIEEYNAQES